MSVIKELDPVALQFNPHDAHREGTLAYYLWLGVAVALRAVGAISTLPVRFADYGADYARFLYWGRMLTVALDLGSVALVYFTLKRVCRGIAGPVFGALVLAIAPFEVIYAHYLRTHIVANFFITLSIFLSTPLLERDDRRALGWASFAAGLAAAAKYTAGIVVTIPLMFWLARAGLQTALQQPRALLTRGLQSAGCLLAGFVIADPFLFFRFHAARGALADQGAYVAKGQFSWLALFDLSRLWTYFVYLIPYGTLPWLWVVFYGSVIVLCFTKRQREFNWSLILFLFIYLYPMAKGYFAAAIFIRGALLIFPVFALLVGSAFDELWSRWNPGLTALAGFALVAPSFLYDLAYTGAMQERDPRTQLHDYLEALRAPTTLAYRQGGHGYFLVEPALAGISPDKVRMVGEGSADLLVLTAFEPGNEEATKAGISSLEGQGKYRLVRVFSNPLKSMGVSFDFSANPHDLQYPVPKLFLLSAGGSR